MKITLTTKARTTYTQVRFDDTVDHTRMLERADHTTELVFGTKELAPCTRRRFISLIRKVIREARTRKVTALSLDIAACLSLPELELTEEEVVRIIAENALMAHYEYRVYKTKPKEGWGDITAFELVGAATASLRQAIKTGTIVAEETNACRDLSNTPGGDMTPRVLASRIKKAAQGTGATVKVLSRKDMEQLKMGALLGVARGAKEQPAFIIVEYRGGPKTQAPIVLVGKGITFDTGGLSLKPAPYMLNMHLDMSGGAAVAHAVIAAARLKLKKNVVALVPAAENSVSGESYRPGDIVRAMNGKTIDVLNTDAEGRLVLADALCYAQRYKPSLVVDVATLTGAALVALGTKASAVLSKDADLIERLIACGEQGGDYLWPLPLWEEYKPLVKGKHADVANIAVKSRDAGTIEGGMFLAEFAEGYPWAHIDIAPRMVASEGDYLADGAAGAPVRTLVRLLELKV